MRKQFLRVKQLADQTFSRTGKTEVLTEDLQEADKRAEFLKSSCSTVGKKLSSCHQLGQQSGESGKEKVLKKSPAYQLGVAMSELAEHGDADDLLKFIYGRCGEAEREMADNSLDHDVRVEENVAARLQAFSDCDLVRHKRTVAKACADVDSARARFQQSARQTSTAGKSETMKEELEDCEQKVEQSRDVLACELFELLSKESDLCRTLLTYYMLQKNYHTVALGILDKLIPELERTICSSKVRPVYGVSLQEHLRVTGRTIAEPIELCIWALACLGMGEEGLFRLTGSASKLKRMKLTFDAGYMTEAAILEYRDPHVIAGALKSYLRELPEPLLTYRLYPEWLKAARETDKASAIEKVVQKLPAENRHNLEYLMKFFRRLCQNQESNKMSVHNVAIVVAPSLMWAREDEGWNMVDATLHSSIVDTLLTDPRFFPGEMDLPVGYEYERGGIDNKGFDLKVADKDKDKEREREREKTHTRNHSDHTEGSEMKRSQSINSLEEHGSPKPVVRRKNKSVAPVPPGGGKEKLKPAHKAAPDKTDKTDKADRPDKPPRPAQPHNSTLPRPAKASRQSKATETDSDDLMTQSVGPELEKVLKKPAKDTKTVSTNTETKVSRPVAAPRTTAPAADPEPEEKDDSDRCFNRKKEWLLGPSPAEEEVVLRKPVVPLKPQSFKVHRATLDTNLRNNYENVSLSSNENLSGGSSDERTLQKTQMYSIDKKQVAIIHVKEEKEGKARDKRGREGCAGPEESEGEAAGVEGEPLQGDDDDDVIEKKVRNGVVRPSSLPGAEKPERPPKPEYITTPPSSSHHRTFSDGQGSVTGPNHNNNKPEQPKPSPPSTTESSLPPQSPPPFVIKHPRTSPPPPPPPVPAKPRVSSAGDSTDF